MKKIPRHNRKRALAGSWSERKFQGGFRGYPVGTIAFYGPDDKLATKVVVSVFLREASNPDFLERWFSADDVDVRQDLGIGEQIIAFLKSHRVRSSIVTDRIIGCPHEEGIDYPDGTACPQCPYWAGRNRFTHERIQ